MSMQEKVKMRNNKLTPEQRRSIIEIYGDGSRITMSKLGELYGVSQGRISQLITNYYDEQGRLFDAQSE